MHAATSALINEFKGAAVFAFCTISSAITRRQSTPTITTKRDCRITLRVREYTYIYTDSTVSCREETRVYMRSWPAISGYFSCRWWRARQNSGIERREREHEFKRRNITSCARRLLYLLVNTFAPSSRANNKIPFVPAARALNSFSNLRDPRAHRSAGDNTREPLLRSLATIAVLKNPLRVAQGGLAAMASFLIVLFYSVVKGYARDERRRLVGLFVNFSSLVGEITFFPRVN